MWSRSKTNVSLDSQFAFGSSFLPLVLLPTIEQRLNHVFVRPGTIEWSSEHAQAAVNQESPKRECVLSTMTHIVRTRMHASISQSVRLKTLNFLFEITGFIIWRDIDFSRRWNISRLYTYYVRVYYNDAEEGRIKPALWILDVIKSMFYLFPRK